jgi:hypothetical protein
VAVLARRILPNTGVDLSLGIGTKRSGVGSVLVPLFCVLAYIVVAVAAARADERGDLYCVRPPWWLQPHGENGWTPVAQVKVIGRLYHSLLRWRYCMPGHTGYSHLQLTHSLLTYILLTACGILLFLGADHCTQEQSILAAVTSSVCSSVACMLGRILFRWGLNTGARKAALLHNEQERMSGFIFTLQAKKVARARMRQEFASRSPGSCAASATSGRFTFGAAWTATSQRFTQLRGSMEESAGSAGFSRWLRNSTNGGESRETMGLQRGEPTGSRGSIGQWRRSAGKASLADVRLQLEYPPGGSEHSSAGSDRSKLPSVDGGTPSRKSGKSPTAVQRTLTPPRLDENSALVLDEASFKLGEASVGKGRPSPVRQKSGRASTRGGGWSAGGSPYRPATPSSAQQRVSSGQDLGETSFKLAENSVGSSFGERSEKSSLRSRVSAVEAQRQWLQQQHERVPEQRAAPPMPPLSTGLAPAQRRTGPQKHLWMWLRDRRTDASANELRRVSDTASAHTLLLLPSQLAEAEKGHDLGARA